MNPKKIGLRPSPHPDWALQFRRPGTELRRINGKYYLYEVSSKYDPANKRTKKVSGKLLGRITQADGFIESGKRILGEKAKKGFDPATICVKEAGFSGFLSTHCDRITQALKIHFPENWRAIEAMAYSRMVFHSPIKNMHFHLSKSMLMNESKLNLTEKKISSLLREIGAGREAVSQYMKSFIKPGDYVLADMTNIFNASNQISLAKEGYNSDMIFDKQFNLLYLYSPSLALPVFYRLFPGNIREGKAFKMILQESEITQVVLVADKGFYSLGNVAYLDSQELQYIIPLKRNSTLIDYSKVQKQGADYITFEGRYIWFASYPTPDGKQIFLFKDDKLMVQEEKDYLNRIQSHPEGYSIEKFHEVKHRMGTIALFTKLTDGSPEDAFTTYKSRNEVEVMFDGMKNILDADRAYMQNDDALQGWMFINHIALQWYYLFYSLLKNNGLLKKYSVNDLIVHLIEVKMVRINNQWIPEPITKPTETLLKKLGISVT